MKAIRGWTGAVVGALLGGSVALGQSSSLLPASTTSSPPIVTITTEPLPSQASPAFASGGTPVSTPAPSWLAPTPEVTTPAIPIAGPSANLTAAGAVESWLNHHEPGCCGPVGKDGPISYDLYLRTGPSLPVGGGTLSQSLNTGWLFRGGLRTLFFSPTGDSAWVVDGNLGYTNNIGKAGKLLAFQGNLVTLGSMSRWDLGLAIGKEWYTQGPGFITGQANVSNISYGFDVGGRWGTSHVDLNRPRTLQTLPTGRHYDVTGGMYGGLNLNYEMPMGGWTFIVGGRFETGLTFTQALEGYGTTLYDVNFLLNAGIRY